MHIQEKSQSLMNRLSIQSFCFRTYKDHGKLIEALQKCGLNKLELCPIHFNPIKEHDQIDDVLRKFRESNIKFTSFGVYIFKNDEEDSRKIFEFSKKAGIDLITAHFQPGSLEIVEKLCQEYGINVALHNHGRKHQHGSVRAIEEFFDLASERIGLCLDTAWMLDSGEDPVEVAKRFRPRLMNLHLKDFVFDRSGKPHDIMLGEGNLKLWYLLDYLQKTDYQGYYTVEYEGDVDNPIPSIQKCIEKIL